MVIIALVALWLGIQLAVLRGALHRADPLAIPGAANKLVLALGLAGVVALELPPAHLLWWWPLSYVLGAVLLLLPGGLKLTCAFMLLIAWPGVPDNGPFEAK